MGRRLDHDGLLQQLRKASAPLDPLYIIMGDEALLVIEALDALRGACAAQGYTERTRLILDARSDWSAVLGATQNVSLFGDRKLLDLALPSGKPGKTGADTLQSLAGMLLQGSLPDTVVTLSLPRLDRASRSAKWASALFEAGTLVEVPDVDRNALPRWIGQRLAAQGQELDAETLAWMSDKVEGNLLAAFQEIQKLGLLYPPGRITGDDVRRAVLDVARYDVFDLRDAMLAGQASRALAILHGLRGEGEALPLILWAVGDEIRLLARLAALQAAGGDVAGEMRRNRVFGPREQGLRRTLARVAPGAWRAAVQHAHDVDRLVKGLKVPGLLDDPWEELARLLLRITVERKT
ncbi:DNA polymerase III subunit delta [Alcaligenaceae bacterium]|nr:DNA polymerase III subunit delta [Alcaligenaceae bacterium]